MKNRSIIAIAVFFTVIGIAAGIALTTSLGIHSKAFTEEKGISKESIEVLSRTGDAMAEVVSVVGPSVVNISTTQRVKLRSNSGQFFDDPFLRKFFGEDFFRQFGRPEGREKSSLGSGVIVDKSGYILTNNHVVKGADEIKVTLADNREFTGKIIGADPKTDLAVVKIDAENLPAVKWGDSDKLRVGETVLAIGSPYGLSQTITSGIVSAKGRANVGIADYEDFIQTDAAINPGNSGGALVNVKGELIGVNTAIFSTSGGYQGIGFAIPSNMAKSILDSLRQNGKVVRGWLGVWIQPVTPELAKQFGLKDDKGAIISDMLDGSPAGEYGIERGDIVVKYNGRPVEDATALRNMVASTKPGETVDVVIIRDGKELTKKVKIAELPSTESAELAAGTENVLNGVHARNITPEDRRAYGIPNRISYGVIVTGVEQDSPSVGALMQGDIILEINRKKISNIEEFAKAASRIPDDAQVLLLVYRDGRVFYLTLSP